jgi:hypothetical protein
MMKKLIFQIKKDLKSFIRNYDAKDKSQRLVMGLICFTLFGFMTLMVIAIL